MAKKQHISNINGTEKDLLDQSFEDGIGYGSDIDQYEAKIYTYGTSLSFLDIYPLEEGGDDSHSNLVQCSRFPMHRYFNSTIYDKQSV